MTTPYNDKHQSKLAQLFGRFGHLVFVAGYYAVRVLRKRRRTTKPRNRLPM